LVEISHSRERDDCKRARLPALLEFQRGARLRPRFIGVAKQRSRLRAVRSRGYVSTHISQVVGTLSSSPVTRS
jgi:hypothetical protein